MDLVETKATLFALGLFAGIMLMLELGRRVGARQRAQIMAGGASGVGAVEAAIFTLLGLLIAFTFQGAGARFDARRALIVQEANNIGTAWLRIDLLPANAQSAMRGLFRQYLDSRLETYRKMPDLVAVKAELDRTARLQREIWKLALDGQKEGSQPVVVGFLPALNQMFDIVTTRTMAARTHPPTILFVMLAIMACMAGVHCRARDVRQQGSQLDSQRWLRRHPGGHGVCHSGLGISPAGLHPRGFLRPSAGGSASEYELTKIGELIFAAKSAPRPTATEADRIMAGQNPVGHPSAWMILSCHGFVWLLRLQRNPEIRLNSQHNVHNLLCNLFVIGSNSGDARRAIKQCRRSTTAVRCRSRTTGARVFGPGQMAQGAG